MAVPAAIWADIVEHLDEFVDPEPNALTFTGVQGRALHRGAWGQRVKWPSWRARWGWKVSSSTTSGTRQHLASKAGMSTKDLMARMGRDDMRAALIYQRATSDADRLIAERCRRSWTSTDSLDLRKLRGADDGNPRIQLGNQGDLRFMLPDLWAGVASVVRE